jgi:hypothetical protein
MPVGKKITVWPVNNQTELSKMLQTGIAQADQKNTDYQPRKNYEAPSRQNSRTQLRTSSGNDRQQIQLDLGWCSPHARTQPW